MIEKILPYLFTIIVMAFFTWRYLRILKDPSNASKKINTNFRRGLILLIILIVIGIISYFTRPTIQ